MERLIFKGCFSPRKSCLFNIDAGAISGPKTIATLDLILTGGNDRPWISEEKGKQIEKCSPLALDVFCRKLQPLLDLITQLCGTFCQRSWICSGIASTSDNNFQRATSKRGLLSHIFASRRWRKLLPYWRALFSPMRADFHWRVRWTSRIARSGVRSVQILLMSHCRGLNCSWSGALYKIVKW